MNTFIIPKNFKMGKYILNRYRPLDFAILLVGSGIGLIIAILLVMATLNTSEVYFSVIGIIIGAIFIGGSFLLTTNINGYFNLLELLLTVIDYYKKDKIYIWFGIDYTYDEGDDDV